MTVPHRFPQSLDESVVASTAIAIQADGDVVGLEQVGKRFAESEYTSHRKADTRALLREREAFAVFPVSVAHEALGAFEFVIKIEISAKRKLTREDPVVVMGNQETPLRFAVAAVGPIRCEFAQRRRVPKTLERFA